MASSLLRLVALVALAAPLAACGDDSGGAGGAGGGSTSADASSASTSTSSDASTSAAGGGNGDGGAQVDPDQVDFEALDACGDDSGCDVAVAQYIDGAADNLRGDVACVLTALRDRTPGVYRVRFDDIVDGGDDEWHHTLVVTPSGQLEVGTLHVSEPEGYAHPREESFEPTRRCDLLEPDFFDGCLVSSEDDSSSAAFDCIWPGVDGDGLDIHEEEPHPPWFEGCVEAPPTCD